MTELAKILRILRINTNDTAKEMAEKLGMSSAYLSAIENGKRNVPQDFFDVVCASYCLSILDKNKLKKAITSTMSKLQIDVAEFSNERKEILMSLSQKDIDDDTMRQLREIMKNKNVE